MSLSRLDPLQRAELEILAGHWRDLYVVGNGDSYHLEAMNVINRHRESGLITGDEAGLLYLRVCQFANGSSDALDLDIDGDSGVEGLSPK